MTGCNFPTLTREDVAALGEIEAVINRARVGTIAALDSAGRMLTHDRGRHVPNHARHVPPVLRASLNAFQHDHCHETIRVRALALMHVCAWRAARIGLCVGTGIRPRRVTSDGLVIVRGRR